MKKQYVISVVTWRSDYDEFERELTEVGVKTLHDERVILKRNESEISLSGIDDPFALNSVKIDKMFA